MFEPIEFDDITDAVIKVVGVGGGGGNAVNQMVQEEIHGVEFFSINTDAQALRKSLVKQTVQIGGNTTKGLGAGANPNVGRQAAEDDKDAIRNILEGADMVFIAAGMGGGTGTGAAPVVAQIAKELGILTVAVVTKPFGFEGKKRMQLAEIGIRELSKFVDSLIVIPNEKLLKVLGKNISLVNAFATANEILRNAVRGISDMITSPGLINVDFADVRTVMQEMGHAMMGTGIASGEVGDGRADKAAQDAVASPLLEDIDLSGARGVLVNITAGMDLGLEEFQTVGDTIRAFASEEATVVIGTSLVPEMSEEIRVTIVATGIGNKEENELRVITPKANNSSSQASVNPVQSGFATSQSNLNPQSQSNQGYGSSSYGSKTAVGAETAKPKEFDENNLFDIPSFLRNQAD
ncbi:cell division protein FtsZ [Testudinibacter aquarius]|uniref:Cell division protein FtsZ n=1 Tax=Testudinibacter aquarius TaxID=1524974 RepID=A0A4R3Y1C9_9PAST|nr:cell division protein FtsZ [Testudinibacter aquarius]KAE9525335.1 cell division protein FtsZ [Testudinibacter aquarius]TCV85307.1 cell division protein FtsZ [Testudinibacter aquarius]TNG92082.1 cell division protein FtsZ [Testudinibacter aquarius]